VLPIAGTGRTFETLVERYVGGGVRASGVLKELLATGAVRTTRDDEVRAIRRSAAAGGADPATVQQLGEFTGALLAAFEHNLSSGPMEQLAIRGITRNSDVSVAPVFRAQMARRAEVLIEGAEALLESRVIQAPEGADPSNEVLLGSYVFSTMVPVHQPEPRWQRGLAARVKSSAAK
jgi:hypothetical protein